VAYRIAFRPRVERTVLQLPQAVRTRVRSAMAGLAVVPRPRDCRKLVGTADLRRIRVGSYRVVYTVDDSARLVTIVKVGHRRDVYR